jgi:hypothetical protein
LLAALRRLWLLPIAVAAGSIVSLPFTGTNSFADDAWILLQIPLEVFFETLLFTAILLPGAAAHVWFVHFLETHGVSTPIRISLALIVSPLIGAWSFLVDSDDEFSAWVSYFASTMIFAVASVWYGSDWRRRRNELQTQEPGLSRTSNSPG